MDADGPTPRTRVFRVVVHQDDHPREYWHVWVSLDRPRRTIHLFAGQFDELPCSSLPIQDVVVDWRPPRRYPEPPT